VLKTIVKLYEKQVRLKRSSQTNKGFLITNKTKYIPYPMDKQRKREQQRPEGLRPEFPRVRAHESSGIRPRLGSQHLPIPPQLRTQPIPEPPEPKLDQKYLDWLDEQKHYDSKIESFSKSVGRLFNNKKSKWRNPIVIPKDDFGNAAVYGLYKRKAIDGPVNWDQFYSTWDRVGEKYKEKPQPGQPFIREYIEFLREKGFRFVRRVMEVKGSYGEVWRVNATLEKERRLDSGQTQKGKVTLDLACKILALEKFSNYPDIKKAVLMIVKEADIHKKLNHENVVKVEEFIRIYDNVSEFPRPIFICLFMELCDGVLSHLIRTSPENHLSEDKARELFKQIPEGLRYLHELNIVHLDLKPNDTLYKRNSSGNLIYKLSDSGLAFKFKSELPKRIDSNLLEKIKN
jgi:hypothetical protein